MSARMLLWLGLVACSAVTCVQASVVVDAASLQKTHDDFKGPLDQRIAAMRAVFDARLADAFSSARLTAMSDDEVRAAFDAAALMAFYDHAPEVLDDQRDAFGELRRQSASARQIRLFGHDNQKLALARGPKNQLVEHPGIDPVGPGGRRGRIRGSQENGQGQAQERGQETRSDAHGKPR